MTVTIKKSLLGISSGIYVLAALQLATVAQNAPGPVSTPSPAVLVVRSIRGVPQVIVPKDAQLVVATADALSSGSAKTGDHISYVVSQDFIVGGYLIAKAGDKAEGQVQEGQRGNGGGPYGIGYHAANLTVSVDRVFTFCGSTLQLTFVRSEYRRSQGVLGMHNDVTITQGQKYAPSVSRAQTVCAAKTNKQPLPIGNDVLPADKVSS